MTDPLPADVRNALEYYALTCADPGQAKELLAKYPKSAPAWQPGDAVTECAEWLELVASAPVHGVCILRQPVDADPC